MVTKTVLVLLMPLSARPLVSAGASRAPAPGGALPALVTGRTEVMILVAAAVVGINASRGLPMLLQNRRAAA